MKKRREKKQREREQVAVGLWCWNPDTSALNTRRSGSCYPRHSSAKDTRHSSAKNTRNSGAEDSAPKTLRIEIQGRRGERREAESAEGEGSPASIRKTDPSTRKWQGGEHEGLNTSASGAKRPHTGLQASTVD